MGTGLQGGIASIGQPGTSGYVPPGFSFPGLGGGFGMGGIYGG